MSETLETKARRIGDDISAIWALIQAKGGMIPHTLNTENLADVMAQITGLSMWQAKGMFMFQNDGTYIDFYTEHEVNKMESLPDSPAGTVWKMTLEQVKQLLAANHIVVLVADSGSVVFDFALTLELDNANALTTSIGLEVTPMGASDVVILDWGDGQSDVINISNNNKVFPHTYAATGTYTITIALPDGKEINLGKGGSQTNGTYFLFGDSTKQTTYGRYMSGYMLSENVKLKYPSGSGYYYCAIGPVDVVSIVPSSSSTKNKISVFPQDMVYDDTGYGRFSNSIIPTVMFKAEDRLSNQMFCNNTVLASVTATSQEIFKNIPKAAFAHCTSLANINIDFSQVETIGAAAFYRAPLNINVLDLTNCSSLGSANFASNSSLEKVILGNTTIADSQGSSQYSQGAFSYCPNLQEVVFTDPHVAIGALTFYGCKNLQLPQLSNDMTIGYGAFAGIAPVDLSTLPDTLETVTGFGSNYSYASTEITNFSLPSNVKRLGTYAFSYACNSNPTTIVIPQNVELQDRSLAFQNKNQSTDHIPQTTIDASRGIIRIGSNGELFGPYTRVTALPHSYYGYMYSGNTGEGVFRGLNSNCWDEAPVDFVFPATFNISSGNPVNSIGLARDLFYWAAVKSITFNQNITRLLDGSLLCWKWQGGYSNYYGAKPAGLQSGDTYEYTIHFAGNTVVPDISGTPFYVGTNTYSNYRGVQISYRPKIVVPDDLYPSWVANTKWSQWAQYIVKESEA